MTAFDDIFTFSRATKKWVHAANGDLVEVAADEQAFDYSTGKRALLLEGQTLNRFGYGKLSDAVISTEGQTLGGRVTIAGSRDGLTAAVVGTGTEAGVPYMDYRVNGTNTSETAGFFNITDTVPYSISAGDKLSISMYLALIDGGFTADSSLRIFTHFRDVNDSILEGGNSAVSNLTSDLTRYSIAGSEAPVDTDHVTNRGLYIKVNPLASVDVTVRVGLIQVEAGDAVTSPIITAGSEAVRAADVIYSDDLEGLSGGYTVVIRGRLNGIRGNYDRVVQLDQGDNTNRQYVLWSVSNDAFSAAVYSDDESQSGTNLEGAGFGDDVVMGFSVNASEFRAFINGIVTPVTSVAEFKVPDIVRLAGSNTSGSSAPASLAVYSIELLDKFSTQEELGAFEL